MEYDEHFYVKYSCDGTYNFNIIKTYSGDLLEDYGGIQLSNEIVSLMHNGYHDTLHINELEF